MRYFRVTVWGLLLCVGMLAIGKVEEMRWYHTKTIGRIPTTRKVVALTIDDGPHDKTTPEILAVLKEKNVRVTFFVLGTNAEKNINIVAQEAADGHEIGIHAYSHKPLSNLSRMKIDEELDKAERIVRQIAPKPSLFRPPGGAYDRQVLAAAQARDYTTILWSVDPHDWQCPPIGDVVHRVIDHIKPGDIILLHDGQYPLPTPAAIRAIITQLRKDGYEFVTVSELLQYYEVRPSYETLLKY